MGILILEISGGVGNWELGFEGGSGQYGREMTVVFYDLIAYYLASLFPGISS